MQFPLERVHNHNSGSVTLNYPCPISRLRVISHSKTNFREAGPHELNYLFIYHIHAGLQYTLQIPDRDRTPMGAWGTPSTFLSVDGRCSQISVSTSHGARRRHFLT
jgi:NAD(P)H-flavin reductase